MRHLYTVSLLKRTDKSDKQKGFGTLFLFDSRINKRAVVMNEKAGKPHKGPVRPSTPACDREIDEISSELSRETNRASLEKGDFYLLLRFWSMERKLMIKTGEKKRGWGGW
ncbi:hypothetical protein CEXT_714001 [Caerostris extrusa]|uniref:Uncharacterized protein n=1 Tax=Caerostris extrusa TaxID=172846 RepID=A0AAV4N466_CAEEX|nr:hypothetical protein CEXT_714001 [Caerostris extrusa]